MQDAPGSELFTVLDMLDVALGMMSAISVEEGASYLRSLGGGRTFWNKELCGLVRCFRIYLREKAKLEITTESPLLLWLVRHCGWILSRYAVSADGRTGYSRLKGREYTSG